MSSYGQTDKAFLVDVLKKKIRVNSLDFSEDIPVSIQSLVLDSWIQDGGQQWTCHLDICTTLNGHNVLKI